MTESPSPPAPVYPNAQELSFLALAAVLLRHRTLIVVLAILGAGLSLGRAFLAPRVYVSTVTFIPQEAETTSSSLALSASAFGISLPSRGTWGPATYLELIRSHELLDPIAREPVVVAERGGRRVPLPDLLQVKGATPALRLDGTAKVLRSIIGASELKTVGGVRVRVATLWPSVSLALANRVVRGVNDFKIQTRRAQAVQELRFGEERATEAEAALRVAENRLQSFLQANRVISSPELSFERDRLQREVNLRQELATSWLKSREDARISEVRNNPAITVFESPRLPLLPEPRRGAQQTVLGGIVGGMLGVLLAFIAHLSERARREKGEDARQFFDLVDEAKPKFLRKVGR